MISNEEYQAALETLRGLPYVSVEGPMIANLIELSSLVEMHLKAVAGANEGLIALSLLALVQQLRKMDKTLESIELRNTINEALTKAPVGTA